MIGIMKRPIWLLGTSLKLRKGDVVNLTPATNQPSPKDKYFASLPEWGGRLDSSLYR